MRTKVPAGSGEKLTKPAMVGFAEAWHVDRHKVQFRCEIFKLKL
jgi:hypothetical protein